MTFFMEGLPSVEIDVARSEARECFGVAAEFARDLLK
jgi:hypothetical protein